MVVSKQQRWANRKQKKWVEQEYQTCSYSYSGRSLKIVLEKPFLESLSDHLSSLTAHEEKSNLAGKK